MAPGSAASAAAFAFVRRRAGRGSHPDHGSSWPDHRRACRPVAWPSSPCWPASWPSWSSTSSWWTSRWSQRRRSRRCPASGRWRSRRRRATARVRFGRGVVVMATAPFDGDHRRTGTTIEPTPGSAAARPRRSLGLRRLPQGCAGRLRACPPHPVAFRQMNSIWPQLGTPAGQGAEAGPLHRVRGRRPAARSPSRSGRLAAHLPRHLRDRPAQPGPADPLRDPQRAPRRAWPSGPTPRGSTSRRCCARHGLPLFSVDTHRPAGEFDLLAFNLSAELVYTNLLNCIDLAGVPVRAADRGPEHPLVVRRRPLHLQPRAAGRLRRRGRARRRRGGGRRDHRGRAASGRRPGAPRAPAQQVLRELAQVPGVYVPSMYDVDLRRASTWSAVTPRYPDVPDAGREAHHRRPGRLALPEAASSCRSPRSCTTGSTSRSSGAAPGAAASARPA